MRDLYAGYIVFCSLVWDYMDRQGWIEVGGTWVYVRPLGYLLCATFAIGPYLFFCCCVWGVVCALLHPWKGCACVRVLSVCLCPCAARFASISRMDSVLPFDKSISLGWQWPAASGI